MKELVYKIRHKETEMFFKSAPVDRNHLSKTGKVYVKKPSKSNLSDWLCCQVNDRKMSKPDDWELVTYELSEVKL